jgi:hypothetical protein
MKELSEPPTERDQVCPQPNLQREVTGLLPQLLRALIRSCALDLTQSAKWFDSRLVGGSDSK